MTKFKLKSCLSLILVIFIMILAFPYVFKSNNSTYNSPNDAFNSVITDESVAENHKFVTLNNYTSYIEDYNNKSGKVITLIHGFGGSTFTFRNNIEFLVNKGFRVLLIDLKGFGLSQKLINTSYYHKDQALKIKEILDYLSITKTSLLGHSMGANVVTHFILSYPEYVEKLILVDGSIIESDFFIPTFFINFDPIKRWGNLFLNSFFTKERFQEFLSSAYYNKSVINESVIDRYYLPLEIAGWDDSLLGIVRDANNKIPEPLSKINSPTLIIWGKNDPWINIENAKDLNKKILNSSLVFIESAGHLPMEESPLEFNQSLLNFLDL